MTTDVKVPNRRVQRMLDKSAGVRSTAAIPQEEAPHLSEPQTAVGMRGALAAAHAKVSELEARLKDAEQTNVPVALIDPNPDQPRTEFDPEELEQLVNDIRAAGGLIQPIVIRHAPGGTGRYQLIAGERRLQAHKLMGALEIRVVFHEASDTEMAMLALLENIGRANLSDYEISKALTNIEQNFPNRRALIREMRMKRTNFYRLMAFEALPDFVRNDLDKRPRLLGGHAAIDLKSELEKLGEKGVEVLRELWPGLAAGTIDQGKLASTLSSTVLRRETNSTTPERDIHKLFVGRDHAGSITKDRKVFALKIKSALLSPEHEKQLRDLASELFKASPQ